MVNFIAEEVLEVLEATAWVRRLAGVSFLGTLDRQDDSHESTDRLEHSHAVARSAIHLVAQVDVDESAKREFIAACLLHDVGHFPFSHSAEGAFARLLGVDHHGMSRWIVSGEGAPDELDSLAEHCRALKLEPGRLLALIDGGDVESPFGPLLSCPLNLDTLEAIARSRAQFGLETSLRESPFEWSEGRFVVRRGARQFHSFGWKSRKHTKRSFIGVPTSCWNPCCLGKSSRAT